MQNITRNRTFLFTSSKDSSNPRKHPRTDHLLSEALCKLFIGVDSLANMQTKTATKNDAKIRSVYVGVVFIFN